jgi:hypothetical protein
MRSLCAALLFFTLMLSFSVWCSYAVEQAIDRLSSTAKNVTSQSKLSQLLALWDKESLLLSLASNRRLLADAEHSLKQMQSCQSNDPLFQVAKSNFLTSLSIIRESCGVQFEAVI